MRRTKWPSCPFAAGTIRFPFPSACPERAFRCPGTDFARFGTNLFGADAAAGRKNPIMKKVWAYALPTLLCFAAGGVAAFLQSDSLREWDPYLNKPALAPPDVVFPIAWSIIYLFMGISAGRVLTSGSSRRRGVMWIWYVQLLVNFLWSILFFTLRSPLAGLVDILLLDGLVIWYIASSARVRASAAWLFVPYLCWVLFATYLNGYILLMNGPGL